MQIALQNLLHTVYVIDTSALIQLDYIFKRENPVFTAIWEEIEDLIGQNCFRTLDFVEDEVDSCEGNEDFLKKWVHKWHRLLVHPTDQITFLAAMPIITEEYATGFFDAKKQAQGKEEADPYLIAYCKVYNYILITNENKNKPNKIPKVAEKNGIVCIDIFEFFNQRGLKMQRKM